MNNLNEEIQAQYFKLISNRDRIVKRMKKAEVALAEVEEQICAIQTVFEKVLGIEPPRPPESKSQESTPRQSISGAVRNALETLGFGHFQAEEVMNQIGNELKVEERQVTKALSRMIRENQGQIQLQSGIIRVYTPGAGSKSAIYFKAPIMNNEQPTRSHHNHGGLDDRNGPEDHSWQVAAG